MLAGTGRRAWAQLADGAPRYFPAHPADPDSARRREGPVGTGDVHSRSDGAVDCNGREPARAHQRRACSGRARASPAGELSALCLTCPHEQCKVDLVSDPTRLAALTGGTATHPLFECACHASVFDAAREGERISGETPRGLYRFRIGGVSQELVEIGEIEEAALYEV